MGVGLRKRVLKFMGLRVSVGRHTAIPAWPLVVALGLIALAAGQAVGPVLSGSATGQTSVTVSLGLTLDIDYDMDQNPRFETTPGRDPDDSVAVRAPDGSQFTASGELHTGETAVLDVFLENGTEADAAAIVEVTVPSGVEVDIEELAGSGNDVRAAQLDRTRWLLWVAAGAGTNGNSLLGDDGFGLIIRPQADLNPGFYNISVVITQVIG